MLWALEIGLGFDAAVALFCLLQVFRPLLNITAEFTAEDLEAALITPNETLDDVHMPLLKVSSLDVSLFDAVSPIPLSSCVWGLWVVRSCCSSVHDQMY